MGYSRPNKLHHRHAGPFIVRSPIDEDSYETIDAQTPVRVIQSNSTNARRASHYTVQDLVTQKIFRVQVHRMRPFYHDARYTKPKDIALHDTKEFHIVKKKL